MTQSSSNSLPPCRPLSKHKMAVLAFLGLLAPVYFVPEFLIRIFPEQLMLVTVLSVGAIVALMSYLIMPALTWLFRGWIKPDL